MSKSSFSDPPGETPAFYSYQLFLPLVARLDEIETRFGDLAARLEAFEAVVTSLGSRIDAVASGAQPVAYGSRGLTPRSPSPLPLFSRRTEPSLLPEKEPDESLRKELEELRVITEAQQSNIAVLKACFKEAEDRAKDREEQVAAFAKDLGTVRSEVAALQRWRTDHVARTDCLDAQVHALMDPTRAPPAQPPQPAAPERPLHPSPTRAPPSPVRGHKPNRSQDLRASLFGSIRL